jgi:hypothetical protein
MSNLRRKTECTKDIPADGLGLSLAVFTGRKCS